MEFYIDLIQGEAILCEAETHGGAGYTQYCGEQIIPESIKYGNKIYPVTAIHEWALPLARLYYGQIYNIIFPKTIKRIDFRAFANDRFMIDRLELPESLLTIGHETFWQKQHLVSLSKMKNALSEVQFKEYVHESISYYIKTVVIGPNVVDIADDAFPPNIKVICHSPFVKRIDGNIFQPITFTDDEGILLFKVKDPINCEAAVCGITNTSKYDENIKIKVPETVTFRGVNYTVTAIEQRAFSAENTNDICFMIDNIELPNSLITIEDEAFLDCYIHYMELPEGVKYVGNNVWTDIVDIVIKLPKTLKYIGYGNLDKSNCKIISSSPYIDIQREMILNNEGEDLVSVSKGNLPYQSNFHSLFIIGNKEEDIRNNPDRYIRTFVCSNSY